MKDDYLQLFMDRDMYLKFVEYKSVGEEEKLHVYFRNSCSSPKTTIYVTCLFDCTHVALEDPHEKGEDEECSLMQVLYRSIDIRIS